MLAPWAAWDMGVPNWRLSARLVDTGTSSAGRSITVQEFAMCRVERGRIVGVWGDLDPPRLPA